MTLLSVTRHCKKRPITLLKQQKSSLKESNYLFGVGPIAAKYKWYDGGISILLAHSGTVGVILLFLYLFIILNSIVIESGDLSQELVDSRTLYQGSSYR